MLKKLKKYGLTEEMVRRPPILYTTLRNFLAKAENWEIDERNAWLRKRVSRTIARARRLSVYSEMPQSNDLAEWSVLRKVDIAGRESAFSDRHILPSYRAATGGTTGTPVIVLRSPLSIVFEQAAIDHICEKASLALSRARVAVLRGDFVKSPSDMSPPYSRAFGSRKRLFSSFHLTAATLAQYLVEMHDFQPDVLMCYPSALQHLLALLEQSGHSIRIGHVVCSSECLPPAVRIAAQRILRASVIDYYGQAERVTFAYAINNEAYFFLATYGAVELTAEDGGRNKILGTSLWNDHQILIRYDTGDIALLRKTDPETLDAVRLGVMPFEGIDGRDSERIDLPDGRRIIGLNHIPRGVPGVASIQLYHADTTTVEALVVPLDSYGLETEAVLRKNFYEKFPSDVTLRMHKISAPARTASGKAPLLITQLARESQAEHYELDRY